MSLLDQLNAKRFNLRKTTTLITHADGSQKLEMGNKTQKFQGKTKGCGFIIDTKPDLVPACILENFLFLGSQDAVSRENIKKYQLTDILSIGVEVSARDIDYNDENIKFHFIECLDLPEAKLDTIIKQTNQIIMNVWAKNGRILIHCNAGVSRSSTICIAFMIAKLEFNFDLAFSLVKSKREYIRPNDGFMKQLQNLIKCTYQKDWLS